MRQDTKEIADLMDEAVDLVQAGNLVEAQLLLAKIAKALTQWVERNLTP
ncbi:hypothetical protein ES703_14997 [subsurface metagenome]